MGEIDQDRTGCGTIEDNDPVRSMRKTKGVLRNTDEGSVVNIGLIFNMIGTPADATKYRYSDASIHETVAGVNRMLNGHYGTALTAPAYRNRVDSGFNGFNINFYVQDVRRRFEMPTTWWHAYDEIDNGRGPSPIELLNYKNTYTLGWGNHEDYYPDALGIAPMDVGTYINVYVCNIARYGYPTYAREPENPQGRYQFLWGRSVLPYDFLTYPELDAFRGSKYFTQFESSLMLQPFSMGTRENPVTWEEAGEEYLFPTDRLREEQITALTAWDGGTVSHELLHWFDNRHVWGTEGTCSPLYQLPDFPSQWVRYRDDREEGRITPGVDDQIYCNGATDVTCDDENGTPVPIWYSNVLNYGPYFNEIYNGQIEQTRSALFQVEEDGDAFKGYFPAVQSLYGPTRYWDLNNPDEVTVKLERVTGSESYRAYVGDTLVWDKFSQPGGDGYEAPITLPPPPDPISKISESIVNLREFEASKAGAPEYLCNVVFWMPEDAENYGSIEAQYYSYAYNPVPGWKNVGPLTNDPRAPNDRHTHNGLVYLPVEYLFKTGEFSGRMWIKYTLTTGESIEWFVGPDDEWESWLGGSWVTNDFIAIDGSPDLFKSDEFPDYPLA